MDRPQTTTDRIQQRAQPHKRDAAMDQHVTRQTHAAPTSLARPMPEPSLTHDSEMEHASPPSESECERESTRRTKHTTTTNSDDPIATPSSSMARSPPQRKHRTNSRERRIKSSDRRERRPRENTVIKAGKHQHRHRRQATSSTDTSVAEPE